MKDGPNETRARKGFRQEVLEEDPALGEKGNVSQGGRAGHEVARKVGTRDEKKRAFERPASNSRVHQRDERGEG